MSRPEFADISERTAEEHSGDAVQNQSVQENSFANMVTGPELKWDMKTPLLPRTGNKKMSNGHQSKRHRKKQKKREDRSKVDERFVRPKRDSDRAGLYNFSRLWNSGKFQYTWKHMKGLEARREDAAVESQLLKTAKRTGRAADMEKYKKTVVQNAERRRSMVSVKMQQTVRQRIWMVFVKLAWFMMNLRRVVPKINNRRTRYRIGKYAYKWWLTVRSRRHCHDSAELLKLFLHQHLLVHLQVKFACAVRLMVRRVVVTQRWFRRRRELHKRQLEWLEREFMRDEKALLAESLDRVSIHGHQVKSKQVSVFQEAIEKGLVLGNIRRRVCVKHLKQQRREQRERFVRWQETIWPAFLQELLAGAGISTEVTQKQPSPAKRPSRAWGGDGDSDRNNSASVTSADVPAGGAGAGSAEARDGDGIEQIEQGSRKESSSSRLSPRKDPTRRGLQDAFGAEPQPKNKYSTGNTRGHIGRSAPAPAPAPAPVPAPASALAPTSESAAAEAPAPTATSSGGPGPSRKGMSGYTGFSFTTVGKDREQRRAFAHYLCRSGLMHACILNSSTLRRALCDYPTLTWRLSPLAHESVETLMCDEKSVGKANRPACFLIRQTIEKQRRERSRAERSAKGKNARGKKPRGAGAKAGRRSSNNSDNSSGRRGSGVLNRRLSVGRDSEKKTHAQQSGSSTAAASTSASASAVQAGSGGKGVHDVQEKGDQWAVPRTLSADPTPSPNASHSLALTPSPAAMPMPIPAMAKTRVGLAEGKRAQVKQARRMSEQQQEQEVLQPPTPLPASDASSPSASTQWATPPEDNRVKLAPL